MITAEKVVRARELLGWTQNRLRRNAGVNLEAVRAVESGTTRRAISVVRHKIIVALEDAGIMFDADGSVARR